jgi:MATE efflux family protein
MAQIKENKMGVAPMLPLIFSMSLPAMFSMLIQSLYNVVDSIFVSKLSEKSLTSITLAFPIQILIISIAVGTAIGLNSYISRKLGEHNQEDANRAATHGIYLAIISSIVFIFIGLFAVKPFVSTFTSDSEIFYQAVSYLQVVSICSVFVFLQINFEKTLQGTGNMLYPMLFQLSGAITNIILDPILIFGLFGAPRLGVTGAAIATVIGQAFAFLFSFYIIYTKEHDVHINIKKYSFNWNTVKEIYIVGFPSMMMQSIAAILIGGLNAILISFSSAAVSILGIYFRLQSFVFMPVFGLTQGLMPIMGYNYGARNKERMLNALKYGIYIALIIMTIGMIIFLMIPQILLSFFHASDEMLSIGIPALRTISISFPIAAIGILLSSFFQALGIGKYSLYVSFMRQLLIILPLAYILSKISTLNAVWSAFWIAELVATLNSIFLFKKLYENRIKYLS